MDSKKTGEKGPGAHLPRIHAVVLNWNGGDMNRRCLDALLACGYPELSVLFVDNGSTDGSAEDVKGRYPGVEVLFTGENLGFTGGNNRGIRRALDRGAELVLILNNDVEVPKGFLEPLARLLEARPGVAGPKVLDPSGKIWCAGGRLSFHQNLTSLRGFGRRDNGHYDRTEDVDYLPACCLLVSREVFDAVGLLEEDYFCYLEDVDFCFRARDGGFPVVYCPDSRIVHHFSHSTGGGYTPARKYMNALNSVRFLRRHGSLKSWAAFILLDVLVLPGVLAVRFFQGRSAGVLAKGRGLLHGFTNRRITARSLDRYLEKPGGEG